MVLGHESSGIVHSVGSAVKTLKPGARVCMEPGIPCRRCTRCREARYNLCHGTLGRFYRLPEDFCYELPEHVPLEQGALMEPAAVAVHVCRAVDIRPGK